MSSSKSASIARLAGGAFLVFAVGFFLVHGREAFFSGSWKYTLTHDDEYTYCVIAKGTAETPRSDANPFYFEERGRANPIPSYLVADLAGNLAKALGIPVTYLLPVWKTLVPFLLWLTICLCLVRLWGYPAAPSAAIGMVVLLSTLFLHGSAQFSLMRFPRPGDGMWLAVIWLSLAMNPDRLPRLYLPATLGVGVCTLALSPYFAVLGLWSLAFQAGWDLLVCRDRGRGMKHLAAFSILLVVALAYLGFILSRLEGSQWGRLVLNVGKAGDHHPNLWSLLLSVLLFLGVFAARRTGERTSRLDRLVLLVFSLDLLLANLQVFMGNDHQMSVHRYYLLAIELLCLLGWSIEKVPAFVRNAARRKGDLWVAGSLIILEVVILSHPRLNYFRYLPRSEPSYFIFDNSLQLLGLAPVVLLSVWAVSRFPWVNHWSRSRAVVLSSLGALAVAGYSLLPSQVRQFNQDFPFDGAYAWLRKSGKTPGVVLTAPTYRSVVDYAPVYTNLNSYINPYGQRLSADTTASQFRRSFYTSLLRGVANPRPEQPQLLRQKLKRLQLDYVLVGLPGPLADTIQRQLREYLREVYRDERCILWQVELPPDQGDARVGMAPGRYWPSAGEAGWCTDSRLLPAAGCSSCRLVGHAAPCG
jgi:hypothetical protein